MKFTNLVVFCCFFFFVFFQIISQIVGTYKTSRILDVEIGKIPYAYLRACLKNPFKRLPKCIIIIYLMINWQNIRRLFDMRHNIQFQYVINLESFVSAQVNALEEMLSISWSKLYTCSQIEPWTLEDRNLILAIIASNDVSAKVSGSK